MTTNALRISDAFGQHFLKQVLIWVCNNLYPEDVFQPEDLEKWAEAAGYIHPDHIAEWAEKNDYIKISSLPILDESIFRAVEDGE